MAKRRKVIRQLMETTADTESAGGYIKEGKMKIMRFVVLALTVFLLTSAWAAPKMSGTQDSLREPNVVIEIEKMPPQKGLICTPHKLVIRKNFHKMITWTCADRRNKVFTIDFGWQSPFPEMSYSAMDGHISLPIGKEFPEGHFPYFVAVLDEDSHQIITSDPDLIIRK
jgi:hypothetical protein